jgi:hypothetical protein
MNLLIVTPFLPWPIDSGGRASQFSVLCALPKNYKVRLIYCQQTYLDPEYIREVEMRIPNLQVIMKANSAFPAYVTPSSASRRRNLKSFLRYCKKLFRDLLTFSPSGLVRFFCGASNKGKPLLNANARSPQMPFGWYPFKPLDVAILTLIEQHSDWADIVQFEFQDYIPASTLTIGAKPVVFVCHQVHTKFLESYTSCRERCNDLFATHHYLNLVRTLETALLNHFRLVIVFADEDKEYLQSMNVTTEIAVSPFPYPVDSRCENPNQLLPTDWRHEIVFLGSSEHSPNLEGFDWFLSEVYPSLNAHLAMSSASLSLTVVGKWSEVHQARYSGYPISFLGHVSDLCRVLRGRVTISPIRAGSGIRTKLLSAAMSASPIVTTSLGCEGIGFVNGRDCLIGDSSYEFASHLQSILSSEVDYRRFLAANAYNHVLTTFSPDAVGASRRAVYETLL